MEGRARRDSDEKNPMMDSEFREEMPRDSIHELLDMQGPPTLGNYEDDDIYEQRRYKMADAATFKQAATEDKRQEFKLNFNYAAMQPNANSSEKQNPIQEDQMYRTSGFHGNAPSEALGDKNALSAHDLMGSSQISELSSYRPGEFRRNCDKELHMAIDELDCPNESSMTIS